LLKVDKFPFILRMRPTTVLLYFLAYTYFQRAQTQIYDADTYNSSYVTNELGFITEGRLINIGKTVEELLLGVDIVTIPYANYSTAVFEAAKALETLNRWTVWKLTSPKIKTLTATKAEIITSNELFKFKLKAIDAYRDENSYANTTGLHRCVLNVPGYDPQVMVASFQSLYETLEHTTQELNDTFIETSEGAHVYTSLVYWAHHFLETLSNIIENLDNRLEILDSLLSHTVPASLNILLQSQDCYPSSSANVEGIDVRYCTQTPTGIYCELHITSQTETEQSYLYELINYKGVQLKLRTPDTRLIRQDDNSWKELTCVHHHLTHTDAEEFQQCELAPFDPKCMDKLLGTNFKEILAVCNFTFAKPKAISMTVNGILLQGNDINSIKEIHPSSWKTIGIIRESLPVLISTNAHVEVNLGHRELTLRPTKTFANRTVNYTWLEKSDIDKLVTMTTLNLVVTTTTYSDIIDVVYGVIILTILPAILALCKRQCQSGTCCSIFCRPSAPKQPDPRKVNYRMNKRLLLQQESPIVCL